MVLNVSFCLFSCSQCGNGVGMWGGRGKGTDFYWVPLSTRHLGRYFVDII